LKKEEINIYLLIIAFTVNAFIFPNKRYRLADWSQKEDPTVCYLQETQLTGKDIHKLKVRGMETIFQANRI
jgi:hypothetical protein